MKLQSTLWAIGLAGVLAGLVGCSQPAQGGPAEAEKGKTDASTTATTGGDAKKFTKKELKITMIAKSSTNPVFLSAQTGADAAAKELSDKTGVKITVDWQTPPNEDPQVQAQKIEEAANGGSDAVLVSCSDAAKLTGAINDAVGKGVPVMTFDSDAPDSKRFAFYGADDEAVGHEVMAELAKQNGGKGNVAILAGNQNAPNLKKRVDGVLDEAKKYPGIKIVGTFYHVENAEDAAAEVLKEMKAYPEIDSWAMIGGWPLFTKTLLTDLDPAKVKIVAVDGLPAELPYIEKGIAPVLLAQPTYLWGYKSVGIIVDKIVNGKSVDAINKMDLVRVDKDSLASWAKQLKDWGFKDVDKDMAVK